MSLVRSLRRVVLWLAVLAGAGPAVAQETAAPPAPARPVPGWRLQAQVPTNASGVAFGLYHRLSEQWDIGLQISSYFQDLGRDEEQRRTTDDGVDVDLYVRDSHDFNFTGYLEFRHWSRIHGGLSGFVGPQLAFGHRTGWRLEEGTGFGYMSQQYTKGNDYSIGAGLVVGADLELVSHLSLTVTLRPLRAVYGWGNEEESGWSVSDPLEPARTTASTAEDSSIAVDTDLLPQAFLTVTF